jgi:hypothetical protein
LPFPIPSATLALRSRFPPVPNAAGEAAYDGGLETPTGDAAADPYGGGEPASPDAVVPFLGFFVRGARGFLGLGGADDGGGEPAFEAVRFMAGAKGEVERKVGGRQSRQEKVSRICEPGH